LFFLIKVFVFEKPTGVLVDPLASASASSVILALESFASSFTTLDGFIAALSDIYRHHPTTTNPSRLAGVVDDDELIAAASSGVSIQCPGCSTHHILRSNHNVKRFSVRRTTKSELHPQALVRPDAL
jgi:hypothetical protein